MRGGAAAATPALVVVCGLVIQTRVSWRWLRRALAWHSAPAAAAGAATHVPVLLPSSPARAEPRRTDEHHRRSWEVGQAISHVRHDSDTAQDLVVGMRNGSVWIVSRDGREPPRPVALGEGVPGEVLFVSNPGPGNTFVVLREDSRHGGEVRLAAMGMDGKEETLVPWLQGAKCASQFRDWGERGADGVVCGMRDRSCRIAPLPLSDCSSSSYADLLLPSHNVKDDNDEGQSQDSDLEVIDVSVSSANGLLAAATRQCAYVLDLDTGECVSQVVGPFPGARGGSGSIIQCVAISRRKQSNPVLVVVGRCLDNACVSYDARTGDMLACLGRALRNMVYSCDVTPDGALCALGTGGYSNVDFDERMNITSYAVVIFHTRTGEVWRTLRDHVELISSVCFVNASCARCGRGCTLGLRTGSWDGHVYEYDLRFENRERMRAFVTLARGKHVPGVLRLPEDVLHRIFDFL